MYLIMTMDEYGNVVPLMERCFPSIHAPGVFAYEVYLITPDGLVLIRQDGNYLMPEHAPCECKLWGYTGL